MTMITPSYLGETIEYSSLHACRSTLEDPTDQQQTVQDEIKAMNGQIQSLHDKPRLADLASKERENPNHANLPPYSLRTTPADGSGSADPPRFVCLVCLFVSCRVLVSIRNPRHHQIHNSLILLLLRQMQTKGSLCFVCLF